MSDGFRIDGLVDFQNLLANHQKEIPEMLSRILESLGEILLDEAQNVLKSTKTPHSRFAMRSRPIIRGANKGGTRNYIEYVGKVGSTSWDSGDLTRSFARGAKGNVWLMDKASKSCKLIVGSNIKHAHFINDGFNRKRRWVPGVVDGSGIFRYQPGAKTGVMVSAGRFMGLHFFEIAFDEIKKVMPEVIEYELRRFFNELG